MNFDPTIIKRGLDKGFARKMAEFGAARKLSPGILKAAYEMKSDGAYEDLAWLGSVPAVQQWLGELNAKEFDTYEFTVKNKNWAVPAIIKEDDIEDDKTETLKLAPAMMAKRLLAHPEKLMIALLIDGDSNNAYDGNPFFDSSSRSFSNLLSGTGTGISALETDLISALVAMAQIEDEAGEPIGLVGDMIVCPTALKYTFQKLVDSKASPTATAGVDTYNPFAGQFSVVGDPRLDADDSNDWYLLCTNEVIQPLIYQNRQPPKNRFAQKNGTKTWIYSADYRGNGAYGLPHLAVKTTNT